MGVTHVSGLYKVGEYLEAGFEAHDLSEIEVAVKEMTHHLGNTIIRREPEADLAYVAARYFTNHRYQVAYPAYRAQGYHIGPGAMESGCKQIGLERLKIAGARWSHDGARLVAKARAAYLSGRWDEVCAQVA